MSAWYDRAFGEWYPRLYPHRDAEEARRAVAMLAPRVDSGGPMLDVGCGAGRHAALLAKAGRTIVGLDRSRVLLAEAAGQEGLAGRLVRGDMRRLPFGSGSFGSVLSMFTSFGYFGPREAHVALLGEFRRVCREGGRLVLDYLNAPRVRRDLVAESSRTIDGFRVVEARRLVPGPEGEQAVKRVTITSQGGETVESYEERVSLYDREDLEAMLLAASWRIEEALGEYSGAPWTPETSRTILIASAEGRA